MMDNPTGNTAMRRIALTLLGLAAAALLAAQPAAAQQVIKLGAYHFPPYAVNTADGMGGLVTELVVAMNAAQDDYVFEIVPTSARNRYADFEAGKFDAIAFENLAWGWEGQPVTASDAYMSGAEVYVASSGEGRDQTVFDDIAGQRIAAVYGYHYDFAGFNADPSWMHVTFTVEQPLNPCTSLYYVMEGRVDVAVVSDLFLNNFLRDNPAYQNRFLISDKVDQVYHHSILVRDDGALPIDDVNAILAKLMDDGVFDRMVEPHAF